MVIAFIPKVFLDKIGWSSAKAQHADVVVSTLVTVLALYGLSQSPSILEDVPHVCLARFVLGIPCPGCGMIRSALELLSGNLRGSLAANLAGPIVCACAFAQVLVRCLAIGDRLTERGARVSSGYLNKVAVFALLAVWFAALP